MQAIQMAYMDRMYAEIKDEVLPRLTEFMASGKYILGDYVRSFEERMAKTYQFPHAAGMANGTDALMIALRASGVGPGDEVIVPAFTIFVDGAVIRMLGAVPQFVEADPRDFNMDPGSIESAITPKTKAILVIHLFGQCADMKPVLEIAARHRLPVIEDACQAIGAKYDGTYAGNFGEVGCFSFYPTKNLGGAGDGGLASVKSARVFETVKLLHLHGVKSEAYVQDLWAYNSRLDAVQALILDIKLNHLPGWEKRRRQIAAFYRDTIKNPKLILPAELPGRSHVYHQFTLRAQDRPRLIGHLSASGIAHAIFYPRLIPNQPAYADVLPHQRAKDWPISRRLTEEAISIPVNPQLLDGEVEYIAEKLNQF